MSVADSEYIAYLDDDDIWFPEHLEVCMEPLMILPNIRAVYTNCYRWINEKALFYQKDKQPEIGEKKHNVAAIINVVHEANIIDEIGAFDDDMRYLEDWDFLYRLSRMVGVLHIEQYTTCYSKRQDPNQLTTHEAEMKAADAIIKERYGREAPKRRMEAI